MLDLDRLVSENRFTIAVIFPLVGAIGFLASAELNLPEIISFNPLFILFGTLVMRLPLIAGLKPLIDRKAAAGLTFLTFYAYLIEYVGLKTGFPYGSFEYLVSLGPIVDGVPIGLPVFFIPLVLNSYLLVQLSGVESRWKRVLLTLGTVVLIDLVLDPAAVALGIWSYGGGLFYGVPLSNFAGWILSGLVAIVTLESCLDTSKLRERLEAKDYMLDDLVSFTFLWGVVNLYYLKLAPVAIVLLLCLMLYRTERFSLALGK